MALYLGCGGPRNARFKPVRYRDHRLDKLVFPRCHTAIDLAVSLGAIPAEAAKKESFNAMAWIWFDHHNAPILVGWWLRQELGTKVDVWSAEKTNPDGTMRPLVGKLIRPIPRRQCFRYGYSDLFGWTRQRILKGMPEFRMMFWRSGL
jgi:hypothetical protein